MSREARQLRCPEDVLGWLPWYAESGEAALGERERGAVEAHAAECAECRAELDLIAGAPIAPDVELPDADALFAGILARIDAAEREALGSADAGGRSRVIPIRRARPLAAGDLARLERFVLDGDPELSRGEGSADPAVDATPAPIRAASGAAREAAPVVRPGWGRVSPLVAAAAAIALLLLGGLAGSTWRAARLDAPVYGLASAPQATGAPETGGRIDVVFAEAASLGAIARTLEARGLEIVAGPSPLGVVRLRVVDRGGSRAAATQAELAAIAERLRATEGGIVVFAEPVP